MTWMLTKTGRAETLAAKIEQIFHETQGCQKSSAEEAAKDTAGFIAKALCADLVGNPVVRIIASGSAWHEGGRSKQQSMKFEFETLYDFVE